MCTAVFTEFAASIWVYLESDLLRQQLIMQLAPGLRLVLPSKCSLPVNEGLISSEAGFLWVHLAHQDIIILSLLIIINTLVGNKHIHSKKKKEREREKEKRRQFTTNQRCNICTPGVHPAPQPVEGEGERDRWSRCRWRLFIWMIMRRWMQAKTHLKSLRQTFKWLWGSPTIKLMPHILPTRANETISKEIGDFYPVFYNAFAWSARSAETLWNALWHTDQKDDLLFTSTVDPYKQKVFLFL